MMMHKQHHVRSTLDMQAQQEFVMHEGTNGWQSEIMGVLMSLMSPAQGIW